MTKFIVVLIAFFGAAFVAGFFDSAHKVAFTLFGLSFTWVLLSGIVGAGLAMRMKGK